MKAISLWQPWGSLWLSGAKVHETRHWHIKDQWRGWKPSERIAIHAAKKFEKDHDSYLADALRRIFGAEWYRTLPTGAIIGSIQVTGCFPADQIFGAKKYADMDQPTRDDFLSGDFSEGRWAWRGAAPIVLPKPVSWRGSQGIFNVPDEIFSNPVAA